MTPDAYIERISLIRSETDRLSKIWRGFGEDEWKTPSFCPGWNAEDVVSHVTTGAFFYANSISRALEGLPPEPPYGKAAKEFHAIRKQKGEELMALPRGGMMDVFDASADEVQAQLERIRPGDLGKLGYHPRGLIRLDAWIGLRLVEMVLHDWDIRYGRDSGARVEVQGVEGLLAFIPANQARFFGWREKTPFEGRFLFRSKAPEAAWCLSVSGEKAEASGDTSGDFDAEIEADGEAHLLLIFGRAEREAMEKAGRLRVGGDLEIAMDLLDVLYAKY